MKEEFSVYLEALINGVPYYIYEGLLSTLCLGVVLLLYLGRERVGKGVLMLLLIEYITLIICSTVIFREMTVVSKYEFAPFWSYKAIMEGREALLPENVMNMMVFIPVGFLLVACIKGLAWWQALLIGGCLSVLIEILQFVFKKGFSEVDDIIHNTIGCLLGYGAYCLLVWFIRKIKTLGYFEYP